MTKLLENTSIDFFSDQTNNAKSEQSIKLKIILSDYNISYSETRIGLDCLGADFETPAVMIQGRLMKEDKLKECLDYLITRAANKTP